jgi:hypothetical protein
MKTPLAVSIYRLSAVSPRPACVGVLDRGALASMHAPCRRDGRPQGVQSFRRASGRRAWEIVSLAIQPSDCGVVVDVGLPGFRGWRYR